MGVFDKFSGIGVASGFKLQAKAPIDPRQVVDTIDDRDALITENGAYEGMQVYVKADKKTYLLKDLAAGTWEELGSGGGGTSVQADYNQNDSTAADYIKNRPFYEETETALAEVFNETLAFDWDTTSNFGQSINPFNGSNPMGGIRGGESVTVVFNGVEYNLTTQDLPADLKESIEAVGGTGFVAGAPYHEGDGWQPTSDFPFTIMYHGADTGDGLISLLIANTSINQASIPVIIKANKTTTELHTINPKYIKDMYYETTTETEVYSGTLTTTASGSKYTASLPLPLGWTSSQNIVEVSINGVNNLLPVAEGTDMIVVGDVLDTLPTYGIRIFTDDNGTSILTREQYTNALLSIVNTRTEVHQVPSKYIPTSGLKISLSVSSSNDTVISNALTSYLKNNPEELSKLKEVENWTLEINFDGGITSYELKKGKSNKSFETIGLLTFSCFHNDSGSNFFTLSCPRCTSVSISTVGEITAKFEQSILLKSATNGYKFQVYQSSDEQDENNGLLAIAAVDVEIDGPKIFNGAVYLHDWITKAQQRSDFQIPTPTKPTDLVDKQYADSLASGGSSLSIELAVGASENTADVFKTYLNNNANVLTQLKAASSFNLKVVKTTSVTTLTETYKFDKNYTNTFTGVQYHFVCIYGSGETSVQATVLWFSISDDTVSDLKLTTNVLSGGSTTE